MNCACRAAAFAAVLAALVLPSHGDNPAAAVLPIDPPQAPLAPPPGTAPGWEDAPTLTPEEAAQQTIAAGEEVRRREALDAFNAAQKQRAYDNDWMLRDYTARLQARGLAQTAAANPDAGVTPLPDPTAPLASQLDPLLPPTSPSPAPVARSQPDAADASADDHDSDASNPSGSSSYLKPLLPPLSDSTKTITRLDAWGAQDIAPAPGLSDLIPAPGLYTPAVKAIGSSDSNSDNLQTIDVPGLTAERQGGDNNGGLNLPDEQAESVTENGDNRNRHDFLIPTSASNSSEFFKKQAEAMQAPNSFNALHPTEVSMALPKPPEPPAPPKQPVTTGIRSHVPDPFDLIGGRR